MRAAAFYLLPVKGCGGSLVDRDTWHCARSRAWYLSRGYAQSSLGLLHRVALRAQAGQYVDHINHDKLNNCRYNLRIGTQSDNLLNRLPTPGRSLPLGVKQAKRRFQVTLQWQHHTYFIGSFGTVPEAAAAYCGAKNLLVLLRRNGDVGPDAVGSPPGRAE
jgi:hypothetical protein